MRERCSAIVGLAAVLTVALPSVASAASAASTTGATSTTVPASKGLSRLEHVVAPGDTLSGIARRYGVDPDEIAAMNDLRDRDLVKIGQQLKVPGLAVPDTLPARLLARPERLTLYPRFLHWAKRNAIPSDLLMATAWLESGWNNEKVSSAGAIGIGQLMPDTARFVSRELIGVELDPKVPEDNIRMSARFLRFLLHQTDGDTERALYGYYQGLRSVANNGVYSDTRRYAADVQALRALFRTDGAGQAAVATSAKGVSATKDSGAKDGGTKDGGTRTSGGEVASKGAAASASGASAKPLSGSSVRPSVTPGAASAPTSRVPVRAPVGAAAKVRGAAA